MSSSRGRSWNQREPLPIVPLPADVIAKIKCSVAITSLVDVLLELVKNSLDAKASKIDISLDFSRGNCIVEDDGFGIPVDEFRLGGGLAKAYHTSKLAAAGVYGRQGTFLSTVAAVSLLTVSSRQSSSRSLNSLVLHHSKLVARCIPGPPEDDLILSEHGTRVSVRDLFGHMPVRVRQRILLEEDTETNRYWTQVRAGIVALLLAWSRPVRVRMSDGRAGSQVSIHEKGIVRKGSNSTPFGSALQKALGILSQTKYIQAGSWDSWIPVSGSTSSVSIKGAFSLDPAPSKQCQFICIDIYPLKNDDAHNELYNEVNRVFSNSSFGAFDEDTAPDQAIMEPIDTERLKRPTSCNQRLRKGVDRWPMFYLRITFKGELCHLKGDMGQFQDNSTILKNILDILSIMTHQWLFEHHFLPKRARMGQRSTQKPVHGWRRESINLAGVQIDDTRTREIRSPAPKEITPHNILSDAEKPEQREACLPALSFGSKIKAGNGRFYAAPPPITSNEIHRGDIGAAELFRCVVEEEHHCDLLRSGLVDTDNSGPFLDDDFVEWTDPSSKKTFLVNKRSGASVPKLSRQVTEQPQALYQHVASERLLRCSSGSLKQAQSTCWLRGLLRQWKNPVFQKSEAGVTHVPIDLPVEHRVGNGNCNDLTMGHGAPDTSIFTNEFQRSNVPVSGIGRAQVISQLDGKFILAKVPVSSAMPQLQGNRIARTNTMLVVIDQHAADERCRVEELFQELCEGPGDLTSISNVGHRSSIRTTALRKPISFQVDIKESSLLRQHAAYFAKWGILYDLEKPLIPDETSKVEMAIVNVKTLPPGISERCVANPRLAIDLLRSEIWNKGEHQSSSWNNTFEASTVETPHQWLRKLSSCPEKLIEMLNSRACRSSIMFNDRLEHWECRDLVKRLSKCVFPFQCAHGRPSLVPLVGLGVFDPTPNVTETTLDMQYDNDCVHGGEAVGKPFVEAYRQWQRKDPTETTCVG